ncbi:hypothetical protein SAMN04487783_1846 [Agrococcus baldri]|uniref:Uncharacterized protein n=1 Tax=Agrococcus baldri TaxID=153730 RepID=A0AA94L039_9MICO|nr:DUF6220 domain-containing protein [Agrococcus baldri]SFS14452.1 hypothetical protein SAMN04487783_1846 [Agrococcus baldri]
MRTTYRVLAFVICGLVMLQAASHAWLSSGLAIYIGEGGTLDPNAPPAFPEALGFMIHGMNGMYVIPVVAILLLVVSFFAKVPRGVMWAVVVLVLVALQVTLGILGHEMSALAFLHGLNALLLFGAALLAGMRAKAPARVAAEAPRTSVGVG